MAALTSNVSKSQIQRALTLAAARVMSALVHNLRNKLIGAILAGLLAPQVVVAGGHGGSHGGGSHSGGHSSSSRSFKPSMSPTQSSSASRGSSKQNVQNSQSSFTSGQFSGNGSKTLVPAKNGNTGINGSGLPGPYNSGGKVIPAKNGNTGINGTGLPQPTGGSTNSTAKISKSDLLQKYTKKSDIAGTSATSSIKMTRSDLLKKYGTKTGGNTQSDKTQKSDILSKVGVKTNVPFVNKTQKPDNSPSQNGDPKNPSNSGENKHHDKWVHNGFPWGWPFYPGFVNYPTPLVNCPSPVVVYEPGPVVVQDPGPVDAYEPVGEIATGPVYGADPAVAETQAVATPPTEDQPAQTQPVDVDSSEPALGNIDLVLEDVRFVQPATVTSGPAYRVKVRNQGTQAAGKFRVGAFAELEGKLSDDSPQAVVEVPSLKPGQSGEVTLRLPVTAMQLVSTSAAQANAFDELLVIVDLDDAVVEAEKTNNVASLERAELEASSN
jgi:hypothetical protein